MKVSFDFDGVLTTNDGIELAREYIRQGNDVWIVTRRRKMFDDPVYKVAKQLGIGTLKVIFTNGEMKWKTILENEIELHIDNNPDEVDLINENTEAEAVLLNEIK